MTEPTDSLPFAPVAVVVRDTGRVHLLSTWDEGVPPEIGRDDLYRMSWNPANLAADLAKIPGLSDARRVGTDGMSPLFAGLIPQLVTSAELVDAAPVMATARLKSSGTSCSESPPCERSGTVKPDSDGKTGGMALQ